LKETVPKLNLSYQYLFVIKRYFPKRSTDANSLYWMFVTAIANYTGQEKYEIHEAYKRMFLPWEEIQLPGDMSYWDVSHTPDQDTKEFNEYLRKIHIHAHEFFEFHLPFPDEDCFKEFAETYKAISKAFDCKFVKPKGEKSDSKKINRT